MPPLMPPPLFAPELPERQGRRKAPRRLRLVSASIIFTLGATGCTSVNHYASARLLTPRRASIGGAFEATQVVRTRPSGSFADARTTRRVYSLYPVFFARDGVLSWLEIGGTLHPARLGGELKIGIVRGDATGPSVSVLVAPALQVGAWVADVPVLVSVPLHDRVELTASPGLAVAKLIIGDELYAPSGFLARGGLAVSVRVAGPVRVIPELTASTSLIGDTPLWATAGLGVAGELP